MKNDLNLKSNQSINHQNSPKRACFDICNDVIFLTHILVVNIERYVVYCYLCYFNISSRYISENMCKQLQILRKNKLQNMHVSVMKVNKELFELLSISLI